MPLIRKILPYIMCSVLPLASASEHSDERDDFSHSFASYQATAPSDSAGGSHPPLLPALEMHVHQDSRWETPSLKHLFNQAFSLGSKTVWRKRNPFIPTFMNATQDEELPENVTVFPLLALPSELLAHILSYLPSKDFLHINEVCQKFYGVSTRSSDIKAHTLTVLNRIDPQGIMAQEFSQRFTDLLNVCKEGVYRDDLDEIKSFLQEWQSYISTLNESIKPLLQLYRRLGGYERSKDYIIGSKDTLFKLSSIKDYKKTRGIIGALDSKEKETYFILRKLSKSNGGRPANKANPILLDLISVASHYFPYITYENLKLVEQQEIHPFSRSHVLDHGAMLTAIIPDSL